MLRVTEVADPGGGGGDCPSPDYTKPSKRRRQRIKSKYIECAMVWPIALVPLERYSKQSIIRPEEAAGTNAGETSPSTCKGFRLYTPKESIKREQERGKESFNENHHHEEEEEEHWLHNNL